MSSSMKFGRPSVKAEGGSTTDDRNLGDAYTFVAIEPHTKAGANVALGKRDQDTTDVFY